MHLARRLGRTALAALIAAVSLSILSLPAAAADSRDCRRRLARAEAKAEAARALREAAGPSQEALRAAADEAVAAYRTVIRRCPRMTEAYDGLGRFAFSTGRMDDAVFAYRGYLQLCPDAVVVASRLGYLLMKDERYEEAVPVYRDLLERHPDRMNDRKQYALALQKSGRSEAAAAQFRKIMAATGETTLNCNEAMLYVDAKDGDRTMRSALRGLAARSESEGCLLYSWEKGFRLVLSPLMNEKQFREALAVCEAERSRARAMLSEVNEYALSVIEEKVQYALDRIGKLAVIEANRRH